MNATSLLARRGPEPLGLAENGRANEYYSAAVRSMSSSWHAFLYGSFDAAGVMTVDKPPLSSWVQVAFVKVFGFPGRTAAARSAALQGVLRLVDASLGRQAGWLVGFGGDDGVGATDVMAKVADTGRAITSVSGLYDVSGSVGKLRS